MNSQLPFALYTWSLATVTLPWKTNTEAKASRKYLADCFRNTFWCVHIEHHNLSGSGGPALSDVNVVGMEEGRGKKSVCPWNDAMKSKFCLTGIQVRCFEAGWDTSSRLLSFLCFMNHLKLHAVPSANSLKPLKTVLTVLSVLLNRNLTKCT